MINEKHFFEPLKYGTESSLAFLSGLSFQIIIGYFSLENIILTVLASILPNKNGIRTGTFVGMMLAPPMVDSLKANLDTKGFETMIPLSLLKAFHFIFSNHKIFFGILGGIIGAIIFYVAIEEYLFNRIRAHILAGGGSALVCFLFTYIVILFLAIANKYGHPRRFIACIEILFVCGVIFPLFGAAWGWVQWVLERISKTIKGFALITPLIFVSLPMIIMIINRTHIETNDNYVRSQEHQLKQEDINSNMPKAYNHKSGSIWKIADQNILEFINPVDGYTIEIGHKNISNTVDVTKTNSYARGDCFALNDSQHRFTIMFSPQGLRIICSNDNDFILDSTQVDVTNWHDYKISCQNENYKFYVDGALINSGTMKSDQGQKWVAWGQGNSISYVQGEALWGYIIISSSDGQQIRYDGNVEPDNANPRWNLNDPSYRGSVVIR